MSSWHIEVPRFLKKNVILPFSTNFCYIYRDGLWYFTKQNVLGGEVLYFKGLNVQFKLAKTIICQNLM
jgi:hypothetical protein